MFSPEIAVSNYKALGRIRGLHFKLVIKGLGIYQRAGIFERGNVRLGEIFKPKNIAITVLGRWYSLPESLTTSWPSLLVTRTGSFIATD
jgi:hypothetical protein